MSVHKHVGDTPLTKKAIPFAFKKHEGQFRKGSGLPYVVHPIEVYVIVRKFKESINIDTLCAAAVLHDTLEDTDTTYEELVLEFGDAIASIVLELTNDRAAINRTGKQQYLDQKLINLSSYALVIKLADILANVGENPTQEAIERMKHHYEFLSTQTQRKLSKTHIALLNEIHHTIDVLYSTK